MAILSLTIMGIPCKGPRMVSLERMVSNVLALERASGLVSMTALRMGFTSAMRRR